MAILSCANFGLLQLRNAEFGWNSELQLGRKKIVENNLLTIFLTLLHQDHTGMDLYACQ